ncbi:MAG: hypothetical protein COW00_00930 [Bdellovibrio sp. CG12_big_fil_rev_8_21_14_0_65_39_13]|nr:MAG: hypothetical protein COW78_20520 [Bdellovibrio sp. CG22_combo_CG10-13_8_21_14_all_39_27]PIQ62819.1 MAG: hypothetical protein COW00_00930 [Bdellovibrio sp. CG12_big_fil_rev_8_21_14_0_65_39_13]PIR32524.1 MAG: hypothetical protein COV37_19490 [Bdellovibrio sp. CG11_big_fil_rev_8_21_14_0_20_39_38]
MIKNICVCIPVYNAESTISETLKSLVEQDYEIKKIKIFDNQSTDKTTQIIQQFKLKYPIIELIVNEVNVGGEGNFTKCLEASEGDYTLIAHSDDVYEKEFISTSVKALEAHPESVATFCRASEIDSQGSTIGLRYFPQELDLAEVTSINQSVFMKLVFQYANFITCPSVVARSSIYRDQIKVWKGGEFKTSADLDVWLRLSQRGSLLAIKKPLIRYRVADASYSYRIAKKRITKHDIFLVLEKYKTPELEECYQFLMMKDQAMRSINIMRNFLFSEKFPNEIKISYSLAMRKMFDSFWHFKVASAIILTGLLISVLNLLGWKRDV